MTTTSDWLRELGATRGQLPTGHPPSLRLGTVHSEYPLIQWEQGQQVRSFAGGYERLPDRWWILGIETLHQLDRETVERILRAVSG